VSGPSGFRPLRVVAVDLATGELEYPDPDRRPVHPWARVLVRWREEPLGIVEVEAPDTVLAEVVGDEAWERFRSGIAAAMGRCGLPAPGARGDVVLHGREPPLSPTRRTGPLISVTVASFRSAESTVRTVRRMLDTAYSPFEVVVVDNDTDPAPLSRSLAAAFGEGSPVRWVHEPRQGLAFARNAGLAAAQGSIVVFTDDDVRVDRHWLPRLVTAFDEVDGAACVTGAILPAELDTPAQLWLEEFGGYHKGFARRVFDATTRRPDSPLYPYDAGRFGSGANVAFRTDVIRGMGGFAVDLGAGTRAHGGEDLDIFRRAISAGHTVVYEPAALMWHSHRRSLDDLRRQMFRYGVGLTATVTKWMVEDPRTAVAIVRRLPAGARHLLSPTSAKNRGKSAGFPRQLTRLEQLGMVCGPVAYLRSRHRVRQLVPRA
jgi:O-antigen biosynthesis protein